MAVVTMKQLLEAGVHFGHQKKHWNQKMSPYIYGERKGIHIINLQKTQEKVNAAYEFVRSRVSKGDMVLFVGTKKQAQATIAEEATRCGMYYVNTRWLGGFLTNFETIRKRIHRLRELDEMDQKGILDTYPPKEARLLRKDKEKLEKLFGGVRNLNKQPGIVFVVDLKKDKHAMLESRKLGIPVVAIVDTNCDPEDADVIIPGNDDAIRAIKLFSQTIADACISGRTGEAPKDAEEGVSEEDLTNEEIQEKIEQLAARYEEKFSSDVEE